MILGIVAQGVRAGGAPPEPTSFKYWKMTVTESLNADQFKVGIAEAGLFVGATAASMAGTYSESSAFSASTSAAELVDGQTSTSWFSAADAPLPQWALFNLTTAIAATSIKLTSGNRADRAARMPTAFTVEGSDDGVTFTVVQSFAGIAAFGISEMREFTF